ncbi:hypothetical protein BH09DEP1_BH09DEP1_0790 [soil metagenome]
MIYFLALLVISSSLVGMEDYQLETQLTVLQKEQISGELHAIQGWKRSKAAMLEIRDVEVWMSEILNKKVRAANLRGGETILTYLIRVPDFGDVNFNIVEMIANMQRAGADINKENANGLTPVTIAIQNGRKILTGGLVHNGAYLDRSAQDGEPNNLIRAGLRALDRVQIGRAYTTIYLRKDCEMMMAYLIDRVLPSTITKSQVHAAWNLGYKDVSRSLAMCRKYPAKRDEIVKELKAAICASFVRQLKK